VRLVSEDWTNTSRASDPPLTLEELVDLVADFKKKRRASRIEAGARMYAFIQASLPVTEPPINRVLFGLPILLLDDLPPEVAHIRDQDDKLMDTFILVDGEEGLKILHLTHPKEPFRYDLQRPLAPLPEYRPFISRVLGYYASLPSYRHHDAIGPTVVRLEPEGPRAEDGSEHGEDQASGEGH
jgi:hypothetical protein